MRTSISNSIGLGVLFTLISMISTQIGSAQAKILFTIAGTASTIALRLFCATVVLFLFLRPWRSMPKSGEWKHVAFYGLSIALMNGTFYHAIERIPLGIAVAIEFSGPLMVAVLSSRRWQDLAGVFLASGGILLIMPWQGVNASLDMTGILFAMLAAFFWGAYIILCRKTGGKMGNSAVAWGMLIGTMAVLPWASFASDFRLFDGQMLWEALPLAFTVGTLASALPYWLELVALRIVPQQTFGVLMSVEPAAAALSGFFILGEVLAFRQVAAIALIITASVLVTLRARNG